MTPQALLWPVQGGHEIDASAEQAIIMKGVVLREFRRTGCRHQCDAEDTAGHPTNNRKNHGTEYHWKASVAQSFEPTTPEVRSLAICLYLAGDDKVRFRAAACS